MKKRRQFNPNKFSTLFLNILVKAVAVVEEAVAEEAEAAVEEV